MAVDSYWFLGALLLGYWLAVIVFIVAQNRRPASALSWILVLCLLPGFGLVFYYFGGRDWKAVRARSREARELHEIQDPFMHRFYSRYEAFSESIERRHADTPIGRLITAISTARGNRPIPAAEVDIWPSGGEYFPHLLEDLAAAKRFIHMQYDEWECDELTAKICDVLADRVRAGVEVRVLHDFLGSLKYKKTQLRALKAVGAQVGSDVTQLRRLNYRNHRKITVVDGNVGHTGGINIGQNYIDGGKKFPSWRDTGIRLTGPAVGELQMLFAERWYEVFGESLYEDRYFPSTEDEIVAEPVTAQTVAQGVEGYWSSSTRAHEIAISTAERLVLLQSPYWVPTPTMLDTIVNAALSGVETRLMMTGLPDKRLPFNAAHTYWEKLIRAGGHIHLYMAGFLHAKTIVVDDTLCAVGTMNLDERSLLLNKEMMVWLFDRRLAKHQEAVFRADLEACVEVTLEDIEAWGEFTRLKYSASRLASDLL